MQPVEFGLPPVDASVDQSSMPRSLQQYRLCRGQILRSSATRRPLAPKMSAPVCELIIPNAFIATLRQAVIVHLLLALKLPKDLRPVFDSGLLRGVQSAQQLQN